MKKAKIVCLLMAAALVVTLPGMTDSVSAKKKASSKIALNRKKAELKVGETIKLKVKNTKKKVKWSTSNKKVATVNKKGKVKAKKVGKANIIAKVGNKKLKCKVTVKKKGQVQNPLPNAGTNNTNNNVVNNNNTPAAPALDITAMTVLNSYNIQIQLNKAQALSASNFSVKIKSYAQGIYNRELRISQVSTTDSVTYAILLDSDNYISENRYVQVSINVPGVGTIAKEAIFSKGAFAYQSTMVYYGTENEAVDRTFDIDDYGYGYGSLVSVTGLPEGISYVTSAAAATGGALSLSSSEIKFQGVPTKTGTFRGSVVTKDELGNTYTYEMIWLIGSKKQIAAAYTRTYGITGSSGYSISKGINVTGGSGYYEYEIQGSSYGLKIDEEGYITGTLTDAGTYNINVKITDAEDKSITTTAACEISIIRGRTISGIVKDAAGNAIRNSGVYLYFENKDKANLYQTSTGVYTDEKGAYSVTLMNGGTYEAYASYGYSRGRLVTCQVTGDKSGVDFDLPVYGITVSCDNDKFEVSGNWYASDDTAYPCYNKMIYLQEGTYELTHTITSGLIEYTGKINVTVNASTTSVKVQVTEKNQLADKLKGEIKAENPVNITYLDDTDYAYYTFVPEADKTYYFFSEGNEDTYGVLMDEDGWTLNSNGYGGNGDNFSFSYTCTAGKTYYVGIRNYDGTSGSVSGVRLVVSEYNYYMFDIQNQVKGSLTAEYPLDVVIDGNFIYYSFTPTTDDYYYFYSTGGVDTYGMLVSPYGQYTDDDNGSSGNFCIESYCYQGETYYVGIRNYNAGSTSPGDVKLAVSRWAPDGYSY